MVFDTVFMLNDTLIVFNNIDIFLKCATKSFRYYKFFRVTKLHILNYRHSF